MSEKKYLHYARFTRSQQCVAAAAAHLQEIEKADAERKERDDWRKQVRDSYTS
jgi:hypothetical protein